MLKLLQLERHELQAWVTDDQFTFWNIETAVVNNCRFGRVIVKGI